MGGGDWGGRSSGASASARALHSVESKVLSADSWFGICVAAGGEVGGLKEGDVSE